MFQDQAYEGNSIPSSAGGGAPAFEQIALLNSKAGYCKRLLILKRTSASVPNVPYSGLEDLQQVMQKQSSWLLCMPPKWSPTSSWLRVN